MKDITPPDAKGKRSFPLWRALLFFLLLAAAGSTYMFLAQVQRTGKLQVADNSVFDTRLQNIENSIVTHENRIKSLEDSTQKLASAASASSSVSSPPSAPPINIATPTPSVPPVSDDRIAAMEKEIASLKASGNGRDNESLLQSIRLLTAFHHLSQKVIGGKPFTAELSAFQQLAVADDSPGSPLATLTPYADSGIPTFASLLTAFDQSVEGLNNSEAVPPPGADFSTRLKYNLTHLVRIHRIDEAQSGSTTDAVVGRAQAHLEKEEIEAAVAEIKSLPENARGNFTAWLDDAQMVTEAPSLVDQIEEQVIQKAFHADPAAAASPSAAPPKAAPEPVSPPSSPDTPKL